MSENVFVKSTGGEIVKSLLNVNSRIIPGYYTSDNVDLYGHIIDPEGMLAALEDYRRWGTIREMHETPVGVVDTIGTPEWNFVRARVSRSVRGDEVLQLVKEGVYGAFSVGIFVTKAELVPVRDVPPEKFLSIPPNIRKLIWDIGDVFYIREMFLVEISIVDRPANPDARMINAVKAITGAQSLSDFPAVYEKGRDPRDDTRVFPSLRSRLLVDAIIKRVLDEFEGQGGEQMAKNRKIDVLNNHEDGVAGEQSFVESAERDNTRKVVVSEHDKEIAKDVAMDVSDVHVVLVKDVEDARSVDEHNKNEDVVGVPADADGDITTKMFPYDEYMLKLAEAINEFRDNVMEKFTKIEEDIKGVLASMEQVGKAIDKGEAENNGVDEHSGHINTSNLEEIVQRAVSQAVEQAFEKVAPDVQRKVSVAKIVDGQEEQSVNIEAMTTHQLAKFLAETVALNIK